MALQSVKVFEKDLPKESTIYVSSAVYNSGTDDVTYTTKTPHGLIVGQVVSISGISPEVFNNPYAEVLSKTDTTITTQASSPATDYEQSYKSGGQFSYGTPEEFYVRYRIASKYKDSFSEWSPIVRVINTYEPDPII